MSPITHFLAGWLAANTAGGIGRRERALIALAGVVPDLDAFGLPFELLTRDSEHPLFWWSEYHRTLGHNLGFALVVTAAALALARRRRLATALLACLSFHLHLLGDLLGSRGPDGYEWPVPYLLPFSSRGSLTWSGQWGINAWPNFAITAAAITATLWLGWKRGFTPLEMVSQRADAALVATLEARFGRPRKSGRAGAWDPSQRPHPKA